MLNSVKLALRHPVSKRRPFSTARRIVGWQLAKRRSGGEVVHDWIEGSRFVVAPGETGLTGNVYFGLHEFEDMCFLLHLLGEEDLFVDAGANVGSYTILASAVCGAKTVAFEPVPTTYDRLVQNVALNDMEARVVVENRALGAENGGEVRFTTELGCCNHVVSDSEEISADDYVSVPTATLDAALGANRPILIKVDVEGFELPLLSGSHDTLASDSLAAVIIETNDSGNRYGVSDDAIAAKLGEFGFQPYSYHPFTRELTPLTTTNTVGNTIFCKDRPELFERLRSAERRNVHGVRV